jgi:hypothetical protein
MSDNRVPTPSRGQWLDLADRLEPHGFLGGEGPQKDSA